MFKNLFFDQTQDSPIFSLLKFTTHEPNRSNYKFFYALRTPKNAILVFSDQTPNHSNQLVKPANLRIFFHIQLFCFSKTTKIIQSQVQMMGPFINNYNLFCRESLMTFIKMELYGTILLVITPNLMSVRILINFWTLSGHP